MTTSTDTAVACRYCGVATTEGITTEVVPDVFQHRPTFTREVGVCPECQTLRPLEPGSAIRAALRLIGKSEDDATLAGPVFEEAGIDVIRLLYRGGEPQARPWEHVTKADRQALRGAYVRVLDARVHASTHKDFEPVPEPPPDGDRLRGCAFCGVGEAVEWGRVASSVLSRAKSRTEEMVLCPECVEAAQVFGAIGPRSWTLAYCTARGIEYQDDVPILGVRPYALQPEGTEPGKTPWAFVPEGTAYPEPPMDPLLALRVEVADLRAEVEALTVRLAGE